ncbi:MAG: class II D-tagatose-bisphosphate aldolase, non-catalytic subunit [Pseudotabrizicola sp.]|uniref:class II D-tagatose-bisphosphate aldolase non-catalytic subunit n=1 Tax=Pseudotabrizicola sp. TaxID=2939647 RepID=UPI002716860F|nr:class II D-tagatose-bisphosphate aldolase, non-catalytic subunit [Pseudotabrizicola sp.]MDO9641244.1 class II D-tagatose-bisphosphate aldolase, non-catalytic subunit [Pseudotabrizicola sp.]
MSVLADIVARNRAGEAVAIPSYCTAHPETLAAIFGCYRDDDSPILIEATCNQVNQFGGYTGMTPAAFRRFVEDIATAQGIDPARLILGGDHLGPNPWKNEPAGQAMDKARAMVGAYVAAGYTKIHLDASMRCADDTTLDETTMAARAADLCAVAESVATDPLHYIIGTEVPVPGGETALLDALAVTTPAAATLTYELHRDAFAARGLSDGFARVIGLVVQPGVDFGNRQIFAYDPAKAAALIAAVPAGRVYEAHSTDYQTEPALTALVQGHFAILKVGPELTFAFRQAVMALEQLEHMLAPVQPSHLQATLRQVMHDDPTQWRAYVAGGARQQAMMIFGLSDRVRYYWPDPAVRAALERLFSNIRQASPEPGLVAQVTGGLVQMHDPAHLPEQVIARMVGAVVMKYRNATGG